MKENTARELERLFSLEGKVVYMTGAAGGIGAVLSKKLASCGALMAVGGRYLDKVRELAEEIQREGNAAFPVEVDVSDLSSIERATESIVKRCGKIDVLITMAAVNKRVPILHNDEKTWDTITGINLKGAYFTGQSVGRQMVKQRSGSIINVASYNSFMMLGGVGIYGAAKSGILAVTRAQAIEWAQFGVRSNALLPGHISTPLTTQLWTDPKRSGFLLDRIAMARPGKPEDLTGMTVLLASDASSYMTGMFYVVDGGCFAGGQPWDIGISYE